MTHDAVSTVAPVDEVLPAPKLAALGFQHVLVMYAGAIAVPLIIGRALKLAPEQVALLINADLFACGIVTLHPILRRRPLLRHPPARHDGRHLRRGRPDARHGAATPMLGILGIFGAVMAAGVFTMLVAPAIGYFLPLFPPVVTGSIILMIGISLMRIGVNWAAGAPVPTLPGYGNPFNLGMAAFVLICDPRCSPASAPASCATSPC